MLLLYNLKCDTVKGNNWKVTLQFAHAKHDTNNHFQFHLYSTYRAEHEKIQPPYKMKQ